MESLVRWNDPKYGFLPPDKFIGALEKEHCIHKLDCYVVDRVCSIIGDRLKKGLPTVPASVNFSRLDFVMTDMLEVVKTAAEKYGVPVVAIVGSASVDAPVCNHHGISAFFPVLRTPCTIGEALDLNNAYFNVRTTAEQVGRLISAFRLSQK